MLALSRVQAAERPIGQSINLIVDLAAQRTAAARQVQPDQTPVGRVGTAHEQLCRLHSARRLGHGGGRQFQPASDLTRRQSVLIPEAPKDEFLAGTHPVAPEGFAGSLGNCSLGSPEGLLEGSRLCTSTASA